MDWVKQKMEHARKQRGVLQGQNQRNAYPPSVFNPDSLSSGRKKSFITIWFLGAAATWIVTIIAAWFVGSSVTTVDVSLNSLGNDGASRTTEVAELKTHIATSMELRNHLDALSERIQLLTDSIDNAEAGLTRVLVMTDAMSGPASGLPSVALQQPPVTGDEPVFEMIEPVASVTSGPLAKANTGVNKPSSTIMSKPEAAEKDAPNSRS